MAKTPRLNEVFIVQQKPINVGSAYSLKKATPPVSSPLKRLWTRKRRFTMNEASLKPELEKIVKKWAMQIAHETGDTIDPPELEELLRDFAHELEGAEGEDPKELDQGGPPAGSTGGK